MIKFLCWLAAMCELSLAGIQPDSVDGKSAEDVAQPARPGQLDYG